MTQRGFRARLIRPTGVGTWTFATIAPAVVEREGFRTHSRVAGTIDGIPFRSSCIPRGGGVLFVVVPKPVRDRIGKGPGDSVELVLALDAKPLVLRIPADFRTALGEHRPRFDRLAPSHRKALLSWIDEAKQSETRTRRITQAVAMIRRGETRS